MEIPLSKGLMAIVDDDMFEFLNQWKWSACFQANKVYAHRSIRLPNKKHRTISMHRLIFNAQKGQMIDHIDGNGLNNQKQNLRLCNKAQNLANSKMSGTRTGLKGVSLSGKKFSVRIHYNGKTQCLGSFSSPEEAARVYDRKAFELWGEFA